MLHAPESTASAWRDGGDRVTECDDDGVGVARTNSPLRLASMPAGGMVEKTRPPAAGSVATAWHGIDDVERARGAGHQRRGHVGDQSVGAGRLAATRWWRWSGLTGSSGVKPQSSKTDDARDDRDQSSSPGGHEAQG